MTKSEVVNHVLIILFLSRGRAQRCVHELWKRPGLVRSSGSDFGGGVAGCKQVVHSPPERGTLGAGVLVLSCVHYVGLGYDVKRLWTGPSDKL